MTTSLLRPTELLVSFDAQFLNHLNTTTTRKSLYISLVRSQLTYCSQVWRPNLIKDIRKLETIQRRATKFILRDSSSSYRDRLLRPNLLPLMYWFEIQDIMLLVKSLKEPPDNLSIFDYITIASGSRGSASSNKFVSKFTRYASTRHL